MHVVQFTNMTDFIADLTAGETAAVYHDLIEQRTATGQHGYTRWQITTIIRAIVANGLCNGKTIAHAAALTIPHGRPVERVNGRLIGPPGSEEADVVAQWHDAIEQHDVIIDHLRTALAAVSLRSTARAGILHVPNDLPLVYAAHPLDELVDKRATTAVASGEDTAADYAPEGGAGSPD